MKKYILLTLIFMVFSICGGEDSSQMTTDENQTTQNLQNEDINTSENVTSKEQEPTQPQQQEPSQKQEPNQPQQPGEPPNGQPQQQEPPQSQQHNEDSGKKIEKAIGIINAADEAILECISNAFGGDIYKKVVEDLNPDDFEAGVVIECRENPETNQKNDNKTSNENNVDEGQIRNSWYDLNIYSYSPQYNAASLNSYSSFGLNEKADILLSGFGLNDSGGKLKINHPVSVSSNGEKLAVTDRFNNRILIWNSIPSQKTAPDIVIGQKNFDTHNSGNGLDELDFPGQVIITPDAKLLVADSDNDRVLVWTNFPQTSGQTADYAIPITNYVSMNNSWPWGVWSDGNKTIVTATVSGTILIWNSFPGSNTPPDVVLTSNQIGTPRSILSNGDYIMIGDENANGECVGVNGNRSTHVFTSWPTESRDPDACVDNWISGTIHENKIYSIPAGGESLYFWDNLYTSTSELKSNVKLAEPGQGSRWMGGDDGGATVAGNKLFIAEYNGNRISVFDSLPSSPSTKPNWSLLTDNTESFTLLEEDFIIQNPVIESDENIFVVSSDFDRSLSVWKKIPGSTGAKPDIVFRRFEEGPWDNSFNNKSLFLAAGKKVFGWFDFENTLNSENYSFDMNTSSIGSINFSSLRGVAYNGEFFALGETDNKNIYIWKGIPGLNDEPDYIIQNPVGVGRIDMNDEWLVVSAYPGAGSPVHVINLTNLDSGIMLPVPGNDDFPQGVSINEKGFFIALQGSNKVVGWSSVQDALNGSSPTMSFGGTTNKTNSGTKMASTVHWDGFHLWVGEFKFSNRLLGFAPSK